MIARFVFGAVLGLTLPTAGLAQSYTAPAGIPAATAPGELEGRTDLPDHMDGRGGRIRTGAAYGTADDLVTGSLRSPHGSRTGHAR